MSEWFKALCYYCIPKYDTGSIPGQGFSAFLNFLQISQIFRANICFQETIGNTKLFALIVAVLCKLPLDVELYHGPLRPFEKIDIESS